MQKVAGGFALDIGNTKTHGQAFSASHQLIGEWIVRTPQQKSLMGIIVDGRRRAEELLGENPAFAGLGFGGPVDPKTGKAKLALVTAFDDEVTLASVSAALNGIPVVHLNDVAASAHALNFAGFNPRTTLLTNGAIFEDGTSALIEVGTGVGAAYWGPDGEVHPSEVARIHASNGTPFGLNLCGSSGFANIVQELAAEGINIPSAIVKAMQGGLELGPLITADFAKQNASTFTEHFKKRYARYLGELLGTMQLAFLATQLFVGGSVGRAPLFLEHILATDEFWKAFSKKDALRGKDMPILRVEDKDATVRGAYAAAVKNATPKN